MEFRTRVKATPKPASSCTPAQKGLLQRRYADQSTSFATPPIVSEVLRSTGRPLDLDARAFMEPRFGHDFSGVRVHTDAQAMESAVPQGKTMSAEGISLWPSST